jgi:hypothetical protein
MIRRLVRTVAVVIALVGSLAGAVIAFPMAVARPRSGTVVSGGSYEVITRSSDLGRGAKVQLTWAPTKAESFSASFEGRVTGLVRVDGDMVDCGQAVLEIDGQPRAAYCSETPPWRPIAGETKGKDRDELETELRAMGLLDDAKHEPWQITQAIKSWQKSVGMLVTGTVNPTDVVWVGPTPVKSGAWAVSLGQRISGPTVLWTNEPKVTKGMVTATLAKRETVFFPEGPGAGFDLEANGNVIDIARLNEVVRASSSGATLPRELVGTVRLRQPIEVIAVPATAIVTSSTATCVLVISDGKPGPAVAVTVVDSQADAVLVEGNLRKGQRVDILPARGSPC